MHPEALRYWVRRDAASDGAARPAAAPSTAEGARISELEKGIRELRRVNEILRSASAFMWNGHTTTTLTQFVDEYRDRFGVDLVCRVIDFAINLLGGEGRAGIGGGKPIGAS